MAGKEVISDLKKQQPPEDIPDENKGDLLRDKGQPLAEECLGASASNPHAVAPPPPPPLALWQQQPLQPRQPQPQPLRPPPSPSPPLPPPPAPPRQAAPQISAAGLGASTSNPRAVGRSRRTFSAPLPQEVLRTRHPAAGQVFIPSLIRPIASEPSLPIEGRVGAPFPPPPPPSAAEIEHKEVEMIKNVVRKWVKSRRRWACIHALIVLLVYYIVGVWVFLLHYKQFSSWDPKASHHMSHQWVNAFYFVTVTMTTVGYGDITPKSYRTKLYLVLLALVSGSGFFYWILQRGLHVILSALSSFVQKRCTHPFLKTRVFKVLAALLGIVCFIVGGILIIIYAEKRPNFVDALYCSVVSIMGIGFGDLSFEKTLGRILATPWLLVSCYIVPELFYCISMKNDLIFEEKVLVHLLLKYRRRANGRPIEVR